MDFNQKLKYIETMFLPVCRKDLEERGIDQLDFVFVSGDAYVDHPSFAAALLGRLLESRGYTVGILCQPDWKSAESFKVLGQPRLAFLVTSGAMDSMVSNYTANNKPRSEDSYSHGSEKGHRPDRAVIQYVAKIREAYKGANVIIGGIEASLRRTAHYDYWSNTVKHSVLLDSKADLLIYGMGEKALLEIASQLSKGIPARKIRGVRGTCWFTGKKDEVPSDAVVLPSFEDVSKNTKESKEKFALSYKIQEENTDAINGSVLAEPSESRFVIQEKASFPLSQAEFDSIYELPFERKWHPMYDVAASNGKKGIPALSEVKFSLTSCRGCFGACSFCAITFHQGRRIQSRSHESLLSEAKKMTQDSDFKGYIHDVGGPTANFRSDACEFQKKNGACKNRDCLGVSPCPNVKADHKDYIELLKKLRSLPNVKKVFIRSGIRFDYLMLDKDKTFLYELCKHHVSGQLKVAPEHVSDKVLALMRKSTHAVYEKFSAEYAKANKELGLKQYLVPYYIAGHPGAGIPEAIETALYLKKTGFVPDQVQDFYPTPGSLATCMYYTGLNPHEKNSDGKFKEVYVARGGHERRLQRALLQFNKKENAQLVKEALIQTGRADLIRILL
ncbi:MULTISPECIES: YgiQ family radical SAM protein [unclassified Treponema]|uniref:YgiQ family radical SAM protein n=1 Tax=unclassified Treponema TaxID=2638727 RepID=UPI0025EB22C0|nr:MULTISPECIES: YgiQ family radical SAM protein [unclassified Treponema]